MKFVLSSSFCPLKELRELAIAADESGWEAMSFSDHVVNPEKLSHDYPYRGSAVILEKFANCTLNY